MIYEQPKFLPGGDRYLLIEFGNEMNLELNFMGHSLARAVEESAVKGVIETAPCFASTLIHYEPEEIGFSDLKREMAELIGTLGSSEEIELDSRLFYFPTLYCDPWTKEAVDDYRAKIAEKEPDPEFVARLNGLDDVDQFVRVHSGTEYWVASLGFWPGLPFMMALDPRCLLTAPKYNPPRTWTPQGTVGMGGASSCIYPVATPGGYQIFGRTPVPIWDTEKRFPQFEQSICLFRPGDRVKFVPCDIEAYEQVEAQVAEGTYQYNVVEYQKFSVKNYKAWVESLDPAARFEGSMLEVIKPGLETSVQDWPGRLGYWNQGFPPSGPMDSWSFRLANLLVGNEVGAAGLEAQYIGPSLGFERDGLIAVTGADMQAKLDGDAIPMWESVAVKKGQTLEMAFAKTGARGYIAIAGGIDTEPWLGSRSTFHKAGVGGMAGHALQAGQVVPVAKAKGTAGRKVKDEAKPVFPADKRWEIEVVAGPNDDWIDEAGHERFLSSDWKLSAKSDRTGFRLDGPDWTFTEKATDKAPEHGSEPSNIIDQGYPCGAINLAGQTPIILVNDGPSMGGFVNPYTVPRGAFWKLGQSKPGEIYNFKVVSVEEAQALAHRLVEICSEQSIA